MYKPFHVKCIFKECFNITAWEYFLLFFSTISVISSHFLAKYLMVKPEMLDTNTRYNAEMLTKNGIHVLFATAVRDDAELLKSALNIAKDRVRLIITTGG